ncbi:MAG: DUF4199 domain-containing protein [Bacteroidales bacterium]|nr:DUF4199 domain-containing protein [Bacteroidales bacterium]
MSLIKRYQSEIHGNYSRKGLKYGLVLGCVLSVVLLFRYLLGVPPNAPIAKDETWTVFAFLFLGNCVALWIYRNSLKDKKITFKEAYLLCLIADVVSCMIYGMFIYIYAYYIDNGQPSFVERCATVMFNSLNESGQQTTNLPPPPMSYLVIYSMMSNVIMAVLASFMSSLLLRNEKAQVYTKEK